MSTKVAVINTFLGDGNFIVGKICSCHRSIEAAELAEHHLLLRTKRYHGQSSYLPTTICMVSSSLKAGNYVSRADVLYDPTEEVFQAQCDRIKSGVVI